jgi:hypothetical protein
MDVIRPVVVSIYPWKKNEFSFYTLRYTVAKRNGDISMLLM